MHDSYRTRVEIETSLKESCLEGYGRQNITLDLTRRSDNKSNIHPLWTSVTRLGIFDTTPPKTKRSSRYHQNESKETMHMNAIAKATSTVQFRQVLTRFPFMPSCTGPSEFFLFLSASSTSRGKGSPLCITGVGKFSGLGSMLLSAPDLPKPQSG